MPLTRGRGFPPLAQSEGVHFARVDGTRIVRCIVTRDALGHLTERQLTIAQQESVFWTHRDEIESAARRKYDAGEKTYGMVTVAAADLAQSAEPLPTTANGALAPSRALKAGIARIVIELGRPRGASDLTLKPSKT